MLTILILFVARLQDINDIVAPAPFSPKQLNDEKNK